MKCICLLGSYVVSFSIMICLKIISRVSKLAIKTLFLEKGFMDKLILLSI